MKHGLDLLGAIKLAGLAVLGTMLAGCMIVSKEPLVTDAEAAAVLPATFYMYGYDDKPDGYVRSENAPTALTLEDHSYTSADGSLTVRFVPLDGVDDTYLAAVAGVDGNSYGVARFRDGILSVGIVLADSDPGKVIDAEKTGGAAGADVLSAVTVEEGGLTVTTRAALDYLIGMNLAGRLPMGAVIAYIGESADETVPATLVPDGDFWTAAS